MTDIDIRGAPSGHELHRLSVCKPIGATREPDPATMGHVELITMADKIVTEVLDGNSAAEVFLMAERYRSLRLQAAVQAGDLAREQGRKD